MMLRLLLALCVFGVPAWAGTSLKAASLHAAAEHGDTAAITAFLDQGASIESRDAQGWTPLICAAHAGQTGLFRRSDQR